MISKYKQIEPYMEPPFISRNRRQGFSQRKRRGR